MNDGGQRNRWQTYAVRGYIACQAAACEILSECVRAEQLRDI